MDKRSSAELRRIATVLKQDMLEDELRYYEPIQAVIPFHESLAHIDLLLAGNGAGKTFSAGHDFALAVTGRHWVKNKYPRPPLDGRICSEKEALSGGSNAIIPLLKRLLRNDLKKGFPKKLGTAIECYWELKNGSIFDIKTYDQDDKAFESVSKDIIWFDEAFRQSIWTASVARMRKGKGGKIIISMTPLSSAAWMHDRFVDISEEDSRAFMARVTIWDNCKCMTPKEHDGKSNMPLDSEGHCCCNGGHIHRKAIELQLAQYDQEERDAREKGEFIVMRDRLFPMFNPDVHVLPNDLTPYDIKHKNIWLYVGCDPHRRKPPAWGIYGYDPDGIFYILDEFPNVNKGYYYTPPGVKPLYYDQIKSVDLDYKQLTREFHDIEEYWGEDVKKRYMDPRYAHQRNENTNELVIDGYRKAASKQGFSMRFVPAMVGGDVKVGEITSGVILLRNALLYNPDIEIGASNMPGLFVNPSCSNHIRMFMYCKYVRISGKASEGRAPSETIEEKFKDFMDITRYVYKSIPKHRRIVAPEADAYNYNPLHVRTGY